MSVLFRNGKKYFDIHGAQGFYTSQKEMRSIISN